MMKARDLASLAAFVLLLAIVVPDAFAQPDPTDLDADGVPGLAEPGAPDSEIPEVVALTGSANLLIDRSHAEDFDVTGFTAFLQSHGWQIASLQTGPITDSVLSAYDVLMVPTRVGSGIQAFSASEVAAVSSFVSDGGGVWLFHEFDRDPGGINSLSGNFGTFFYFDRVVDSTNNEGNASSPTIHILETHPITQGVASYGYYGGCCLLVDSPASVIARGDDDAFSSTCHGFPPVLAVTESMGRIVFAGDITPLHPSYYPENLRDEEELLLQNIANWLAHKPPTATHPTTWGGIKGVYR